MAALNIQFTDEEMAVLRAYAERHDLSLKAAAKKAIVQADHNDRVHEAIVRTGRISAGLLERLADK